MRCIINGTFVRVFVSRAEVDAFKASWPCNNLPKNRAWFEFDGNSGDLVDTSITERFDGRSALALSQHAQHFAAGIHGKKFPAMLRA